MSNELVAYLNGEQFTMKINVDSNGYIPPNYHIMFEDIVKLWNDLHKAENRCIIGNPSISYENDARGKNGILLPLEGLTIKNGTSIQVDIWHNG